MCISLSLYIYIYAYIRIYIYICILCHIIIQYSIVHYVVLLSAGRLGAGVEAREERERDVGGPKFFMTTM